MENEKQIIINSKEQEIINLTNDLTSPVSAIGDYKIIKCYEAALLGKKDMPSDVNGLVEQRQAVRDKINALQAEVKALRAEAQAE